VEVAQRLTNHGQVLDLGCAFGFALEQLVTYFKHLVGADVSKAALTQASKVVPQAELHELDLEQHEIPVEDGSCDLILALDVLEHLKLNDPQNPEAHSIELSLNKIKPKLAPGGRLVISVPVTDISLISRIIWNHLDHDQSHVSKPTEQQLSDSIKHAGFEVESQRFFFPLATPLGTWKVPIPTNIEMVLKLPEVTEPPAS
jgi:SAM-dependent methyltransferase